MAHCSCSTPPKSKHHLERPLLLWKTEKSLWIHLWNNHWEMTNYLATLSQLLYSSRSWLYKPTVPIKSLYYRNDHDYVLILWLLPLNTQLCWHKNIYNVLRVVLLEQHSFLNTIIQVVHTAFFLILIFDILTWWIGKLISHEHSTCMSLCHVLVVH